MTRRAKDQWRELIEQPAG